MERPYHRRSKSASPAEQKNSNFGFGFPNVAPERGEKETRRRQGTISYDSNFHSSRIPSQYGDMLAFDLGCNPVLQVSKTPIKKLLAEEMINESESKRRPPSLVARLMGLDGFPIQQSAHKHQHNVYADHIQQKKTPLETHRNAVSYDGCHARNSSMEQQEFKDVFEVIENPKYSSTCATLKRTEGGRCSEENIEYIRQKFRDAKRLSSDEKLQNSKEFYDALEVLDSNKGLLLKFLQEPECLFTNQNSNVSPPKNHGSNITVLKSGKSLKHKKKLIESECGRKASFKDDKRFRQKQTDVHSSSHSNPDVQGYSKIQSQLKDGINNLPTKIVVLKPNFVRSKDSSNSMSSVHSSGAFTSHYRNHMEFTHQEPFFYEEENSCSDPSSSRYNFRKSKAIPKKSTGRIRSGLNCSSINTSTSYKRGYAGDDSSSSRFEDDSETDSEAETPTSGNLSYSEKHYVLSSSLSNESSVNREAKKRLSEQWKMAQRNIAIDVANKSSNTLGEMLSNCDGKMIEDNFDSITCQEDLSNKVTEEGKFDPLGISSRDGCKDSHINNFSRSRSLPKVNDIYLMQNDAMGFRRNKVARKKNTQKDGTKRSLLKTGYKKSCEIYYRKNHVQNDFEDRCSDGPGLIFPEMPTRIATGATSVVDDLVGDLTNARNENMITPEFPVKLFKEARENMIQKSKPSLYVVDDPIPQEHSTRQYEVESLTCSKEIDQPSPISVLEVPFVEDPSSGCECFERVNADIQGLRMQLQLLKSGAPYVFSDEEQSVTASSKGLESKDTLQYSYITDVLNHISFSDAHAFVTPWAFHELENKYSAHKNWSRCERRLVFDRIESEVLEISKKQRGLVGGRCDRVWVEHEVRRAFEKGGCGGGGVENEWGWVDLGESVGVIGKEIEGVLVEEVVMEILLGI